MHKKASDIEVYEDVETKIFEIFKLAHPEHVQNLKLVGFTLYNFIDALGLPFNEATHSFIGDHLSLNDEGSTPHNILEKFVILTGAGQFGKNKKSVENQNNIAYLTAMFKNLPADMYLKHIADKAKKTAQGHSDENSKKLYQYLMDEHIVAIGNAVADAVAYALPNAELYKDLKEGFDDVAVCFGLEPEPYTDEEHYEQVVSRMTQHIQFFIQEQFWETHQAKQKILRTGLSTTSPPFALK